MIPSIGSVKELAGANLGDTVRAMLNLIEDVSLFILSYKLRNSFGAYNPANPEPRADEFLQ
jgi:hypothetical protein